MWSTGLVLLFGLHSGSVFAFPDTQDLWFRHQEAIDYLQQKDIIGGYPDPSDPSGQAALFKPDQLINRAEFLKIVFKGRSDTEPVGRRCFSDVNPDAWYAPYVCAAARRGIVDGYADGTFQPGQTINTAEALKIVLNAYNAHITETSGEQWYQPYVEYLDTNDILAKHSYIPWAELDRLHAADLIWRLLRYEEDHVVPRYSAGCGKAQPSTANSIVVNGTTRTFLLTVPASYVIHDPVPLLVAFHGRTNDNQDVRGYYGFDREANNAIIVYPAARTNGNGTHIYEDEEVQFFDELVEYLANHYCIDMDSILVAGHSLGGWFANKIACIRGDVVRASASLGTSGYRDTCTGPAAAMIIHNPNDRLAPFSGSETIREERIAENGCSWDTTNTQPSELNCQQYLHCSTNPVTFCAHTINEDTRGVYYPHNWPRNTGRWVWDFFSGL